MASGEIRAGKAYVELFVKGDFKKSLDQASKQLKAMGDTVGNIGKKFAAVGVAITAPLVAAATHFASVSKEIEEASVKTGIGVQALQELKYAAEESGVGFDDLQGGIAKMNKTIYGALVEPAGDAAKALATVGLSASTLLKMSPEDRFQAIGDALNNIQDDGVKAGVGMGILGKSAVELFPMLATMKEAKKHAEDLGIVMGKDDVAAGAKFANVLKDIWSQVDAVSNAVGAAVGSALEPFAESASHILKSVIGWVQSNKTLVIGILTAGVAIAGAGAALIALGGAISLAGVALGGIVSVIGMVGSALMLLLNPIVLIGGGLLGLAVYFGASTKYGADCLAWLGSKFDELKATATEAFGGIADALGAGDIMLAANILWTGLQVAWISGTQELQKKWIQFKAGFVRVAADAFYGAWELWEIVSASLQTAFVEVTSVFKTAWNNTTSFLGSLWDGFVNTFVSTWQWAVNAVSKALNYIHHLWDKTFDSDAANNAADAFVADQKRQRDQADITAEQKREADTLAANAAIENAKKVKKAQIDASEKSSLSDLAGRNSDINGAADKNAQADIEALNQKKIDLQKQLDQQRQKAGKEKADKKSGAEGPKPFDPAAAAKAAQDALNNRQDVGQAAKANGNFGGAGVRGLLSGPALTQKQIAANTAAMEKHLRTIAQQKNRMH